MSVVEENPELVELDASTLAELGEGAVGQQVLLLLKQAVADCRNRPKDKRARKLILAVSITPKAEEVEEDDERTKTVLTGTDVEIDFDLKIPKRKTMKFDCGLASSGLLVFNPRSPTNHRQRTLPGMLEPGLDE